MPTKSTPVSVPDRIAGAIFGHLCGDAFGVPYEFQSPRQLPKQLKWGAIGTHAQPTGTWSDDGAMMLCHVASFAEHGRFDVEDTGRRFVRWRDEGYMAAGGVVFDVGITTSAAIGRMRKGVAAIDAGQSGESDNGNGSLMRVLPVALWALNGPLAEPVTMSQQASLITHGHPRSQVCCAVYAAIVHMLMTEMPREEVWEAALNKVERIHRNESDEDRIRELALIRDFRDCLGRGYVVDTLVSAWQCFAESSNYVETIERAVRLGNDTDTTAAVAGSLAGAWWGLNAVPKAWRDDLRITPEIRSLIERFITRILQRVGAGNGEAACEMRAKARGID